MLTRKQSELSSECWMIQLNGLHHCITCELRDTEECGGQDIRKTGENEKGYVVPLGD